MTEGNSRLADYTTDIRVVHLSVLALFIGAMSAVVAYLFDQLIGLITNFCYFLRYSTKLISPVGHHLGYWAIFIPVIGGLIGGLMARYGSEKLRGDGIPEALESILIGGSRIEPIVAFLKPLTSAIAIGTGGPFGAEGPIIMTGGAFASVFAQFLHLTSAERKTLLVAGAAGGLAAIFSAPVASVLMAVEIMLFEWKPRSFIPVAISCGVASAVRIPLLGPGPIFGATAHAALGAAAIAAAMAVGLIGGLVAGGLTHMVYAVEDGFAHIRLHWMWWPALGGLCVGIGGIVNPRVLGAGYDTIHLLLQGHIVGIAVLALLVDKAVVWALALGSGMSGGVVAPLLIVGGAMGALLAHVIPGGDPGLWAMVGMASVMSGAMRCPLASTVFALEVTHDVNALPAVLLGCMLSFAVTVLLLPRSILTEKIARRGHHLSYEYTIDPLEVLQVGEIMDASRPTARAGMLVSELLAADASKNPELVGRQGIPLVDDDGKLAGIVTQSDLLRAVEHGGANETLLQAGSSNLIVTYPDERLREAVVKMLRHDIGRLPVVSRDDPQRLVGYLGRSGVMSARIRRIRDEQVRERGFDLRAPLGRAFGKDA